MKAILEYTNERDQIIGRVHETEAGYSVSVFDIDSGDTFPLYYRFTTLAQAAVKAKHLANLN